MIALKGVRVRPRGVALHFVGEHGMLLPLGVAAAVLLSRLPFLGAGYGDNWDAWAMARAARAIALTHSYVASRLPGYPLPEIAYSLLWRLGPLVLNGVTAALSAVGTAYFALSLRELGSRDAAIAAMALAFTPVIFISSTISLDYVWALSFILMALYYAIVGRSLIAGVCLGLAIASRITSGAMLLPLALLLVDSSAWAASLRRIAPLAVAAGLIGGMAFIPDFGRYGWGFFTFIDLSYPSPWFLAGEFTVWTWGLIGSACVALGVVVVIRQRLAPASTASITSPKRGRVLAACWTSIGLYAAAFLRDPHLPAYLIPAVPFVLLLLACLLDRRILRGICAGLLLSPFFLAVSIPGYDDTRGIDGSSPRAVTLPLRNRPVTIDAWRGPILRDHAIRAGSVQALGWIVPSVQRLPKDSVVVAGSWYSQILAALPMGDASLAKYVFTLDGSQATSYAARGFTIYYLPGQRDSILEATRNDPVSTRAIPLPASKSLPTGYEGN